MGALGTGRVQMSQFGAICAGGAEAAGLETARLIGVSANRATALVICTRSGSRLRTGSNGEAAQRVRGVRTLLALSARC